MALFFHACVLAAASVWLMLVCACVVATPRPAWIASETTVAQGSSADLMPDLELSEQVVSGQPEALPHGMRRVLARRFSVALASDWREVPNDHGALIVFAPLGVDGVALDIYREAVLVERSLQDAWCRQYAAAMPFASALKARGDCGREIIGGRDVATVKVAHGNVRQWHMLFFTEDGVYILVLTTTVEREVSDLEILRSTAASLRLLDTTTATVAAMERLRYRFAPPKDWLVKVVDGEAYAYRPIVDRVRPALTGMHISWVGERYADAESRKAFVATFREALLDRFIGMGLSFDDLGVPRQPWVMQAEYTVGTFPVVELTVAGMAVADDPLSDTCYRIAVLFGKKRSYVVTLLSRLDESGELALTFREVLNSFSER